jgi:flagellar biosynthesis protein FliR
VLGLVKEVGVGLLLGWTTGLVFAGVQMAGEWLDLQGGLQAGQVLNPAFESQSAPLGNLKHLLAGLVFFGSGGHAIVLRAAAASLGISPPGELRLSAGTPEEWMPLVAHAVWLAVQLAAPVAGALFLAEIAIAVGNRALPQVNVMMLTLPLKALIAAGVLALSLPALSTVLDQAMAGLEQDLVWVLRIIGG